MADDISLYYPHAQPTSGYSLGYAMHSSKFTCVPELREHLVPTHTFVLKVSYFGNHFLANAATMSIGYQLHQFKSFSFQGHSFKLRLHSADNELPYSVYNHFNRALYIVVDVEFLDAEQQSDNEKLERCLYDIFSLVIEKVSDWVCLRNSLDWLGCSGIMNFKSIVDCSQDAQKNMAVDLANGVQKQKRQDHDQDDGQAQKKRKKQEDHHEA